MNLSDLEKNILEKSNKTENNREKLIKNILDLSVNTGKINKNSDYILYSEKTNEDKKKKIEEIEKDLYQIIENVVNISNSLQISLNEICKKNNK